MSYAGHAIWLLFFVTGAGREVFFREKNGLVDGQSILEFIST